MTALEAACRVLVPGPDVEGAVLKSPEPLSLWGGLNPETGEVIDRRHPSSGACVTGRIWFLPSGRGSSSASSILLEAVRLETAPAAFVLNEIDPILVLGAAVAREMYKRCPAIVLLPEPAGVGEASFERASLQQTAPGTMVLRGS